MYTPEDTPLLLDVMLGGLVSPLRMIGYDTAYALERDVEADEAIIELADREKRRLLTRDQQLAAQVQESHLLSETDPHDQLAALEQRGFELELDEPQRCSRCNSRLQSVTEGSGPRNGPDPNQERVWQCRACGQYYWKGSHWDDLATRLARLN